jgi:hypothetical protein
MDLYYKTPLGTVSSIVLLLTTQCIGFGLAGESDPSAWYIWWTAS